MVKSLQLNGYVNLLDDTTSVLSDALNISENYSEVTVLEQVVDASASDDSISFGGIASDVVLAIIVPSYATVGTPSEYLTVKVNGGTESIPFGKLLVLGGHDVNGVDSLSVSNPDASNSVSLKVYLCK